MSDAAGLRVVLDDGPRLAGALLAAGAWPEQEQAERPYKPHRVAEAARRALGQLRQHPAVQAAEALAGAPDRGGVERLFEAALTGDWPPDTDRRIEQFAAEAQLDSLKRLAQPEWEAARADLEAVLGPADPGGFLTRLLGPELPPMVVFPNLLYPGRQSVTGLTAQGWLLCQPPPPAWGMSPPWRYTERDDEVLARVTENLARAIIGRKVPEPQAEVFGLAAAVLLLRETQGHEAADQFMLMEKRARGLPDLPRVAARLEGCRGIEACVEAMTGARIGGGQDGEGWMKNASSMH